MNPTTLPSWQHLIQHQSIIAKLPLRDLLQDANRCANFTLQLDELLLDYSKNHLTSETINLLCQLAKDINSTEHIDAMFNGNIINYSEQRPALHIAWRNINNRSILVNGKNIVPFVNQIRERLFSFSEKIRNGEWLGCTRQRITDIVNLGIGGSDLGPQMVVEALTSFHTSSLKFHFISNIDSTTTLQLLKTLNPATTLFIISSKSFTTPETLANAEVALEWFSQFQSNTIDRNKHFVAVTNNINKATEFGITHENIFAIPEWVGGRYSLWSAVGLPIILAIGKDNFMQLLQGAYLMDEHFRTTTFRQNIPVILGLINIWYNNFFHTKARAILPYANGLKLLPHYLQQAEMESTGKNISWSGKKINYSTGQIIFGEIGTNGQHAFYQLLHQGTQVIPTDFIVPLHSSHTLSKHQAMLIANAFSQSKALAEGKTLAEVCTELRAANYSEADIQKLAPHKVLPGNQPSNTIALSHLTPKSLGLLIALYEHKIYVQSIIWQINAFDQWGVELGKQLADMILPHLLQEKTNTGALDNSTMNLINFYRQKPQI